jgi:hypothetical protein
LSVEKSGMAAISSVVSMARPAFYAPSPAPW